MQSVRISPNFQVVIPPAVRAALGLKAGQRLQIVRYQGRIELIPLRSVKKLRGFLKGINPRVTREKDRV